MYCLTCGSKLSKESEFCSACGSPSHYLAKFTVGRIFDWIARAIVVVFTPIIVWVLFFVSTMAAGDPKGSVLLVFAVFILASAIVVWPLVCAITPRTAAKIVPSQWKFRPIYTLLPIYLCGIFYPVFLSGGAYNVVRMVVAGARETKYWSPQNVPAAAIAQGNKEYNPEDLFKRSRMKDAEAQFALVTVYGRGIGVKPNNFEAGKWLLQAAINGHPEAQYWMGTMHMHGQYVPEDWDWAVKWLEKSSNQGYSAAQYELASLYDKGKPFLFWQKYKDQNKALKWYEEAAKQKHAKAQFMLGCKLIFGDGVSKNEAKGNEWMVQAAENGDSVAREYSQSKDESRLAKNCKGT